MASTFDLLVIGGGINGCGIVRDAAGRGLRVGLLEMNDLGAATSCASTKLFHGGLRYLEYFEFRLVREALIERENLLQAMPHISWPLRFVLPVHPDLRFDSTTPTARLLRLICPWMKGRRPAWLIRFGLFLYDSLGGRRILPATRRLDLRHSREGQGLKAHFRTAFEYSDCWVEDARLVVLNARDAQARGAEIFPRTKCTGLDVVDADSDSGARWRVRVEHTRTGAVTELSARMVVNAAGPWVGDVLRTTIKSNSPESVRLIRGSHIVTRRLFDHEKCYLFQGTDGRIIFAIPYETDFTLIGTTDCDHPDAQVTPDCTPEERDYLIDFINRYLAQPINTADVVWSFSGVRPLYDDGAAQAASVTRDYLLKLDKSRGAPVLNIFGGKITTYRRLAESALEIIGRELDVSTGPWTAGAPLPGGDFPVDGVEDLIVGLRRDFPYLDGRWARRLVCAYGTEAQAMLHGSRCVADLGQIFGATLSAREVNWLIDKEYACDLDDILWRRSKLGLHMTEPEVASLRDWLQTRCATGTEGGQR